MSVAKPLFEQVILPHPAKETLPTMYDLPSEDPEEPGLPDVSQLSNSCFYHKPTPLNFPVLVNPAKLILNK